MTYRPQRMPMASQPPADHQHHGPPFRPTENPHRHPVKDQHRHSITPRSVQHGRPCRTTGTGARTAGVCASFTGMCVARSDSALGDHWEVPRLRRSGRDRLDVLPCRLGLSTGHHREWTGLPSWATYGARRRSTPAPNPLTLRSRRRSIRHRAPEPHAAGSLVSSRPRRSRSKRGACGTHSPAPQNYRIWAPLAERTERRVGRDLGSAGTGPAATGLPARLTA